MVTLDLFKSVSYIFLKLEIMKKPKSKSKQMADHKRAAKRGKRLKESRKKVAAKKQAIINKRKAEKEKFLEFIKKMEEARAKGQF